MRLTAKEKKIRVDNRNFLKLSCHYTGFPRVMKKFSLHIAKLIAVFIASSMFISTSIPRITTDHARQPKEHAITGDTSDFLSIPNSFTGKEISESSAALFLSYYAGRTDTGHQNYIPIISATAISLQKRIQIVKESGARNEYEIKLAQEALNELLRMQNDIEDENDKGNR